ncbi:MAG: FecR domain-containing protein [Synechococcus sp.]
MRSLGSQQRLFSSAASRPRWRRCFLLGAALLVAGAAGSMALAPGPWAEAAGSVPRVVDVPSRPAFVRPPGRGEQQARAGQVLAGRSVLRTQKPGRMQVQLPNGRNFRLGGDAVLRLAASGLDLERGQIIAWIDPGTKGGPPLRVKTRVGTASIEGTTVFLEVDDDEVTVFSWEGRVRVTPDQTAEGKAAAVPLDGGWQMSFENGAWQKPRRITPPEAQQRRRDSILLNGFDAPMATLPVIERELGLQQKP